jgi:hypothetical protein
VGNDGDALGVFEHLFRNAAIGCGHDLVDNLACMIETIVSCFAIGSRSGDARDAEDSYECHKFFHQQSHHFLPMRGVC